MADDYSAHLSPQVFALCWSRRYVFIPHGGGVTPVAQTPDTDLNQHVKREYTDRETGELLHQMREGIVVPQLRQEECLDIMVDVLSNMALHLHAAKGYLKTGLTVDLDGLQDQEIVREAGQFWTELGMRAKRQFDTQWRIRLGLMRVHRVGPKSWLLGRRHGMDLQSR